MGQTIVSDNTEAKRTNIPEGDELVVCGNAKVVVTENIGNKVILKLSDNAEVLVQGNIGNDVRVKLSDNAILTVKGFIGERIRITLSDNANLTRQKPLPSSSEIHTQDNARINAPENNSQSSNNSNRRYYTFQQQPESRKYSSVIQGNNFSYNGSLESKQRLSCLIQGSGHTETNDYSIDMDSRKQIVSITNKNSNEVTMYRASREVKIYVNGKILIDGKEPVPLLNKGDNNEKPGCVLL